MTTPAERPVVLVARAVMDGTVVRWYRSVRLAENQTPVLSASRNGVMVHAEYLTSIPDDWIAAARETHTRLATDRNADVDHLATHRHKMFSNGPLEEVSQDG